VSIKSEKKRSLIPDRQRFRGTMEASIVPQLSKLEKFTYKF